jgi:hypothetical protein
LTSSPFGSNIFVARTWARLTSNGNLTFGIAKRGSTATPTPVYGDSIFTLNTTYLLVVKYVFNTGSTTDDQAFLYVFSDPTLPASEPPTPYVGPATDTQADATDITFVGIRQGNASSAPSLVLDGIRVGLTWNHAPLPIQLSYFTGTPTPDLRCVRLNWRTLSEINNYGFYVQRSSDRVNFVTLPNSFVPGHGTTNEPHDYTYLDCDVTRGVWYYRLKQIDLDGTIYYTDAIRVELNVTTSVNESAPKVFELQQNYPNPFNPETRVRFSVETTGKTTLRMHNLIGQEVATLFDGVAEAGRYYDVKFSGAKLTSGVYFYKLENGKNSALKKLMLVK